MKNISNGYMIIFDHDGTLVDTSTRNFVAFSGIKELLVDLKKAGLEISVWTARPHQSTVESLKKVGIAEYIGEIYGSDDGIPKPHPMGLEKVSYGIDKDKVLHIGDSLGDILGAKAFGIPAIAACWSGDDELAERLGEHTDLVAHNVLDCKKIIATVFNISF